MKLSAVFGDRQFYRNLFTVALPIMLQTFFSSTVNMISTVIIGRLGTVEIASVGLGNQIFFLYNLALFGLCSGASIFTAQFWGRKDIGGIRRNLGLSLVLALSGGVFFTAAAGFAPERIMGIYSADTAVIKAGAEYLHILSISFIPYGISMVFMFSLRSVEKVRLPMVASLIALSVNVIFTYCLVFGAGLFPALGIRGAAVAAIISRITEMSILLIVSYSRKYPPAGNFFELLNIGVSYIRKFFHIVFPVLFNEVVWSTGMSMQSVIFARTNTDAIAAFNITGTINQLIWVFILGMGNGVAILIGKKIGEGDDVAARNYARWISTASPVAAIGGAGILLLLSRIIPPLFNVNSNVISHIRLMFIILAAIYPLRSFNMNMIVGVCRAGGDTVFCAVYDVVFMWGLALPLAAAAAYFFHAPVWLLYLFVMSDEIFKLPLGLWRLRSGKWLRNVTGGN